MRLEDLPARLEEIKNKVIEQGKTRVVAAGATAMKAEMVDRIFNRGEDANGSKIGDYSTKEAYYSKEDFVRKSAFKAGGKGGKSKTKTPKSMYLKDGYKEFRDIQGRKTDTMNFKLTGSLEKSINVVKDNEDIVIAITDDHESKKRQGLEKHVGKKVFTGSKSDYQVFKAAVRNEIEHLRNSL